MKSTDKCGAFAERFHNNQKCDYEMMPILILSTKRSFSSYFSNYSRPMSEYISSSIGDDYRNGSSNNDTFGGRILEIFKNDLEGYTKELKYIFPTIPDWTLDSTNRQLEIKFPMNNSSHNSNGAGEGLNNLFVIVDSYLNTDDNCTIVIDEPEISLHPDIQRNLLDKLIEQSKNKQIIITTHSPYFVDFSILEHDGKIFRVVKREDDNSYIYGLNNTHFKYISKIINNDNNPHILGIEAREILFLNDNVILVEGQDDIVGYKKIFQQRNFNNYGSFFGWGLGGSGNFENILPLFQDLGYLKVFCIADGDSNSLKKFNKIKLRYTNYYFYNIKADDIRNKVLSKRGNKLLKSISQEIDNEKNENIKNLLVEMTEFIKSKERNGLVSDLNVCDVKTQYEEDVKNLIEEIKKYFNIKAEIKENVSSNLSIVSEEIKVVNACLKISLDYEKLKQTITKLFNITIDGGGGYSEVIKIKKYIYDFVEEHGLGTKNNIIKIKSVIRINIKTNKVLHKKIRILENTFKPNKLITFLFNKFPKIFLKKCYK